MCEGRTYLRYEANKISEPLCIVIIIGFNLEYSTNAVVVVELLHELIPVTGRVSFDEILELGKVPLKQRSSVGFAFLYNGHKSEEWWDVD